ncbi:unnamed protein product [Larinioides sclopetarius]|uniref:Uncharacterized protein n=1 Tax=Larinioides sclopetarius TaxID=280406 RepID=A0AAV1Z375_9ARAC
MYCFYQSHSSMKEPHLISEDPILEFLFHCKVTEVSETLIATGLEGEPGYVDESGIL